MPKADSQTARTIKYVVRGYLRPFSGLIFIGILANVIVAGAAGSLPWFIQQTVDNVFNQGNRTLLWLIPLGILVASLIRGAATYLSSIILNYVGQRMTSLLQRDIFAHLIKLDLADISDTRSGDHIAIFLNDAKQLTNTINTTVISLFRHLLTLIALIGVMLYINWHLASIFIIIILPMAAFLTRRLGRLTRKASHKSLSETGKLSAMIGEMLNGLRVIKAYGQESKQTQHIQNAIEHVFGYTMKTTKAREAASPVMETLAGIAIACIILWGGMQSIQGNLTAGEFTGFISAVMMAYRPLRACANIPVVVQEGVAAGQRIFSILDTKPKITEQTDAPALNVSQGEVIFDNVSFAYKNRDTQALENVNIHIKAGQTVAFVGPSGAGKSTLMNLVLRFFDVTNGAIKIDGQDIRDVSIASLRQATALVTQEPFLFADTIGANIGFGSPHAARADIEAAAKAAAIDDFIAELPDTYDTFCGEGGMQLSGGQRQRIVIARAILKNAPILLLDEATSALDTASEKKVQKAISQLTKNRTAMIIAHRLSTIMHADWIYVLKDGQVKQSGTHQSLLDEGGLYADLYHAQFENQEEG